MIIVRAVSVVISVMLPLSAQALETLVQNRTNYPDRVASGSNLRPPPVTAECTTASGTDLRSKHYGLGFFFPLRAKHCDCREDAKIYEWLGEHDKAIKTMDSCQPKPRKKREYNYKPKRRH